MLAKQFALDLMNNWDTLLQYGSLNFGSKNDDFKGREILKNALQIVSPAEQRKF